MFRVCARSPPTPPVYVRTGRMFAAHGLLKGWQLRFSCWSHSPAAVQLTGRFSLNGGMSRADSIHDHTPGHMNPGCIRSCRSEADPCFASGGSLVGGESPTPRGPGAAFGIRFPFLCRLGTVRLMSVSRAELRASGRHREHCADNGFRRAFRPCLSTGGSRAERSTERVITDAEVGNDGSWCR